MDDLLAEFLAETSEGLASLDIDLVQFEHNPHDTLLLGKIFRIVHTIKGTCGFFSLPRLELLTHACENVLGQVRNGELAITSSAITLILAGLDRIRFILTALEANGTEPPGDDVALIQQLDLVGEGKEPTSLNFIPLSSVQGADIPATDTGEVVDEPEPVSAGVASEEHSATQPDCLPAIAPSNVSGDGQMEGCVEPRETQAASSNIRVNLEVIESLMTTVSELVLTRNQLMQMLRSQKESQFAPPLQRLSHLTTELQECVMKVRMQPIQNAWAKFPRLVRELGLELNKKIELRMSGGDTELDRQVLELIKDPLTHMIRNSADHGIETPAQRLAAGKPEQGMIALNAFHDGGQIIIELLDDGRGLDTENIARKALHHRLTTEAEIAVMSDDDIHQFIFRPGFTTAQAVTNVSGRGVGMDVVLNNIEKIGGVIFLRSRPGQGSTITIKIPLTLAIVSVLIVECQGERFALPQSAVSELVRPNSRAGTRIDRLNGVPVLRLRDRLMPLISLRTILGHGEQEKPIEDGYIVIATVGTRTFGIVVDRVFDTEEIVVKPVSRVLRHIPVYSGTTILGDGTVIMILDPNRIASSLGMSSKEDTACISPHEYAIDPEYSKISYLIFKAGNGAPKATPLSQVARLEEIDASTIEITNGRPVIQYRGKLMPLIALEEKPIPAAGTIPILVFSDEQHSMGLVVERIIDIIEDDWRVQLGSAQPGIMGSAVIAGAATDLVDISYYLQLAYVDWFGQTPNIRTESATRPKRLLLVDDSSLFRNLAIPILKVAGYSVWSAEGVARAVELCESGIDFDAVITDIEMPGSSGYELAAYLRGSQRWSNIPFLALTAHVGPKEIERGKTYGFSDFIPKFDRDRLLSTLQTLLDHKLHLVPRFPGMEAA